MNLVETLIALTIAAGVIVAAVESSYSTARRAALAQLQSEAVIRAEALLARAGSELPLREQRLEGAEGSSVQWILDMRREGPGSGSPKAFQVMAEVMVTRDGLSVHEQLATLKLDWESLK